MRFLGWKWLVCALSLVALGVVEVQAQGVGSRPADPNRKKVTKPGSSTDFSWSSSDINACRTAGKPIMLYIWDDQYKKDNFAALHLENNIFPDPDCREALKGYGYVMLRLSSAKGWPAEMLNAARDGCALYLMTCDGMPYGNWVGKARPERKVFIATAKQVAAANAAAAERMVKNPPKKFEDAPKPEEKVAQNAKAGDPAVAPEEKKPGGLGNVPGLPPKKTEEEKEKEQAEEKKPGLGNVPGLPEKKTEEEKEKAEKDKKDDKASKPEASQPKKKREEEED